MCIYKKYLITIILLTIFIIVSVDQLLAASFTIDSLNLQEALPQTNPPEAYFKINLKDAWMHINDLNLDLSPVIVGIIDTGFDSTHPEFDGLKFGNTPAGVKTDVGELINGDLKSHGTQVAGIVGANNISFPNPENYILPQMNGILSGVKNLDYILEMRRAKGFVGIVTLFSSAKKIFELSNSGTEIINLSLSTFNPIGAVVFDVSFSMHPDILFIVAAGNNNFPVAFVAPANLGAMSNVITVGAITLDDQRVSGTNFGSAIGISAPGELVFSPTFFQEPLDLADYEFFSGTSAAAPMVTGVAGLLKAIKPELTASEIKNILIQTADPITTDQPIGDRLNALKAIEYLLPPTEWSLPETIYSDPKNIHFAAATSDNLGDLHLVWGIGGRTGIYYAKRNKTGWSEPIIIPSLREVPGGSRLDIASDNLGRLHLVSQGGWPDDVFYVMWDGTEWSEPLNITNTPGHSSAPKIVADNNNNPHVVWSEGEVFYTQWNGLEWTEPVKISPNGYSSGVPYIVSDGENHLHVIMTTYLPEDPLFTFAIFYTKFDGLEWSEPINLIGAVMNHYKLTVDKLNHPHILFCGRISGKHGMYHIYWNGINWTSPVNIPDTENCLDPPHITVDDSGTIHAVWRDFLLGQIIYSRYDGTDWSEPEVIPNIPATCDLLDFVADIFNHVHVIYQYYIGIEQSTQYLSHIWR